MATATREHIATQLLHTHVVSKPSGARPQRLNRRLRQPRRLPSPTVEELEQREHGWNDRFVRDSPSETKRANRLKRDEDHAGGSGGADLKEKKIRDERHQYGHADAPRHQRPGGHRLEPLEANLSPPPREPDTSSSKEEKLRFKVLKAIDVRETLIYQLNALILCTPVQEALVMAASRANMDGSQLKPRSKMAVAAEWTTGSGGGVMSNAREAVRLAQQLASDLQTAGILVVEGLVEWMLEAGAKAETPPEFTWRGRNYFLKMDSDLDFAGPELRVRGVDLDCFSTGNALCVRPDQRLGRVLAARAIIQEMVEMARQSQEQRQQQRPPPTSARKEKKTPRSARPHHKSPRQAKSASPRRTAAGADELILATGRENEEPFEEEDPRDEATEQELVSMLDESVAVPSPQDLAPTAPTASATLVGSTKSSARDEYDNSFDEEDAPFPQPELREEEPHMQAPLPPPEVRDEPQLPQQTASELVEETRAQTPQLQPTVDSRWTDLAKLLGIEEDEAVARLQRCAAWSTAESECFHVDSQLVLDGRLWRQVLASLDGSLLALIKPQPSRIVPTLTSDPVAISLSIPQLLKFESHRVINTACSLIAQTLQRRIVAKNPLVSEVDLDDVLHEASSLFHDSETQAALEWVAVALFAIDKTHDEADSVSDGLSALVQVFYPYLVAQPRDRLPRSWHRVTQLLEDTASIALDRVLYLLSAPCKLLALTVEYYLSQSQQGDDTVEVAKLTLVCDRHQVLVSSVAAVDAKCHLSRPDSSPLPVFHLFPFFESSFGEKTVDGKRVEEGEGKGPLKEWFTVVASELTAKWRPVTVPHRDANEYDPVVVNGNKLVVDGLPRGLLQPGYRLDWRSPSNEATSRVVNKCDAATGTYLLDRGGVANQSFQLSELGVWQPQVAFLEYIQASESYWLNEAVPDTPANRTTLRFVGWLIANALVHQCSLQLRLHRLLYDLLLRPDGSHAAVTLVDLEALDPSLYTAMIQMKRMKPAEFVSYLEFEGLPVSLTVDEYIAQTIEEKVGAKSNLSWQLKELRHGFHKVLKEDLLGRARVSPDDLADQLSGDHTTQDDFVIHKIFRLSLDGDFAACAPLQRAFWHAVESFDGAMKRRLVKFITGVDTLPPPGTEFLRIEMPFPAISPLELEKTLRMLPQSHTCDNTLELPHYWRALCWKNKHDDAQSSDTLEAELTHLLIQKLHTAADYSSGYGLDAPTATSSSLAGILPRSRDDSQLSAQESYDSLDLPALGEGSAAEESTRESASVQAKAEPETTDVGQSAASPRKGDDEYGAEDWEEEELAD